MRAPRPASRNRVPARPTVKPMTILVKGEIPSTGPANWASWTQPAAKPGQHSLGLAPAQRAVDHDQQEGVDDAPEAGHELAQGGRHHEGHEDRHPGQEDLHLTASSKAGATLAFLTTRTSSI